MNDELKNILDEFMNFDFNSQWERMEINEYERNILKDYITNLQQAVKNTKETADDMLYELNEKNVKLKSRIEKAVELINKYELIVGYYDYADENGYWDTDSNNNLQEELKDTLNGRSDE